MRRLLYVPIIHDEADLGSAGATLARESVALSGERRWTIHEEAVRKFWESVAAYLRSFDPRRLKVYQDGLAADGEMGRRIVEKAACRGSRNYQLILELLGKGAESRKTEDPVLLWREHENIRGSAQQGSAGEGLSSSERYRLERDRLMEKRDKFIAETIDATLKDGELGVLFIGAYHDVAPRLAADISIEMVKDREKVQAYFKELLQGRDDRRFEEIARHLASPVSVS